MGLIRYVLSLFADQMFAHCTTDTYHLHSLTDLAPRPVSLRMIAPTVRMISLFHRSTVLFVHVECATAKDLWMFDASASKDIKPFLKPVAASLSHTFGGYNRTHNLIKLSRFWQPYMIARSSAKKIH